MCGALLQKKGGDKIQVTFADGNRGTVALPPNLAPGTRFRVRPPRHFGSSDARHPLFGDSSSSQSGDDDDDDELGSDAPSATAQGMRGAAIGMGFGSALVLSPLIFLEGKSLTPTRVMLAKILQPACSVPVAFAMVASGAASAYTGVQQEEERWAAAKLEQAGRIAQQQEQQQQQLKEQQ